MKASPGCDGPFFTGVRPRLSSTRGLFIQPQRNGKTQSCGARPTASASNNGATPGEASQNGASYSGRSSADNAFEAKDKSGGSLDKRILSGEFTDEGSTKEKLTRPLRKALAKDPVGPGAQYDSTYGARL